MARRTNKARVAESGATSGLPRRTITLAAAENLLDAFDVREDSRDYLAEVIASGNLSADELDELYRLSLMAGVEEWNMRIECATTLRDRVLGEGSGSMGLYLCLQKMALGERFAAFSSSVDVGAKAADSKEEPQRAKGRTRRGSKKVEKGKSPFWGSDTEAEAPKPHPVPPGQARDGHVVAEIPSPRSSERIKRFVHEDFLKKSAEASPVSDADTSTSPRSLRSRVTTSVSPVLISPAVDNAVDDFEAVSGNASPAKPSVTSTTKRSAKSPYFTPPATDKKTPTSTQINNTRNPSPSKATRPPRGTVSCLPFPTLSAPHFGLVQERLAHNPFRLLIAVTFLIRTHGRVAIPVFEKIMERWPTPEALAAADRSEFLGMAGHLGLGVVRFTAVQKYARIWCENPPSRERRYGVKNYPRPGDGKDVRAGEVFGPEMDTTAGVESSRAKESAWELGHLTQGKYAIDSWRIFCRDVLLGRSKDWKGSGREPGFQPEWMRVLPDDKELRACLRWMWMREGWEWDPVTGEREVLREEMRRAVDDGKVEFDNQGQLQIMP